MAKLGTGLVRFGLGLFPKHGRLWLRLGNFGGNGAVYGADSRPKTLNMVAYSSIGHMGYVLLGAAAATQLVLWEQSPRWSLTVNPGNPVSSSGCDRN